MDRAFELVLGLLMLILTALAALAADRTAAANESLETLTATTTELASEVRILRNRVDGMPSPTLLLRVEQLEKWRTKVEDRL